jgi:hypothetical protein
VELHETTRERPERHRRHVSGSVSRTVTLGARRETVETPRGHRAGAVHHPAMVEPALAIALFPTPIVVFDPPDMAEVNRARRPAARRGADRAELAARQRRRLALRRRRWWPAGAVGPDRLPRPRRSGRSIPELTLFGETFDLAPRAGALVIFPGWLQQYVHAHRGERPRICVSCNLTMEVVAHVIHRN